MKMRILLFLSVGSMALITCKQYQEVQLETKTRHLKPAQIAAYHQPLQMTVAWVPYEDGKLVKTGNNEWKIIEADGKAKKGNVPMMLITYPDSDDTLWLDMNMKNELLGKLIKHSLMTQEPIKRPFGEFFETASCQKCHPADVKVDFEK